MGQKEVNLPNTAVGWAIHLTKMLNIVSEAQGTKRFPVDVAQVAIQYSESVFPSDPIRQVEGHELGTSFEGALIPVPSLGGWGILFNSSIKSAGRKNFTLAHELGHYLLHRRLEAEGIKCLRSDMWGWNSEYGIREAEANTFASNLLMPRDDFDAQTAGFSRPNVADFDSVSGRYKVSTTAAILRWIGLTRRRAMIVMSRDGFIDWSWGSKALLRSNVFFRPKSKPLPIPSKSLANTGDLSLGDDGVLHPIGVWSDAEEVYESILISDYHDFVISLLIYPNTTLPPTADKIHSFQSG